MDIIEIIDSKATSKATAKATTPLFKYVKPYTSPNVLPKATNPNEFIVKDTIVNPTIETANPMNKINKPQRTVIINRAFQKNAKYLIKTYNSFKQDDIEDHGFLSGHLDMHVDNPRLWFKDTYEMNKLTWIISGELPIDNTSLHSIKNIKSNKYLAPAPIAKGILIGSTVLSDAPYNWKITDKNGQKYIHTNELYLTHYNDKYRMKESITLEPLDENKKQNWNIELDPNTFNREKLDKVLNYSNGGYLKQLMDSMPPGERFEFYKGIQNELPLEQRLPEALLFIRSMTNNFMLNTGQYIDQFDAVQYVSRYISDMAEKIRGEKKGKYLIGGSLLKNMYEDEMKKNPLQNKKEALKKCVNVIMDNK